MCQNSFSLLENSVWKLSLVINLWCVEIKAMICQKFSAFRLSRSFAFPDLSTVKNFRKIFRAFESQNFPKIFRKSYWKTGIFGMFQKYQKCQKLTVSVKYKSKIFENFENRRYLLNILPQISNKKGPNSTKIFDLLPKKANFWFQFRPLKETGYFGFFCERQLNFAK